MNDLAGAWNAQLAALAASAWRGAAERAAAAASRAFGVTVPVDLVLAIVAAESSGNPAAVRREPDGRISRGLMQVLEGTARELGFRKPLELHVPAVGLEAGSRYLAKQLSRYGGRQAQAIAAYNAGTASYTDSAREHFRNQAYVDKVAAARRHLASGGAVGAASTWALAGVVGLVVLLALMQRRRRRGSAR